MSFMRPNGPIRVNSNTLEHNIKAYSAMNAVESYTLDCVMWNSCWQPHLGSNAQSTTAKSNQNEKKNEIPLTNEMRFVWCSKTVGDDDLLSLRLYTLVFRRVA